MSRTRAVTAAPWLMGGGRRLRLIRRPPGPRHRQGGGPGVPGLCGRGPGPAGAAGEGGAAGDGAGGCAGGDAAGGCGGCQASAPRRSGAVRGGHGRSGESAGKTARASGFKLGEWAKGVSGPGRPAMRADWPRDGARKAYGGRGQHGRGAAGKRPAHDLTGGAGPTRSKEDEERVPAARPRHSRQRGRQSAPADCGWRGCGRRLKV